MHITWTYYSTKRHLTEQLHNIKGQIKNLKEFGFKSACDGLKSSLGNDLKAIPSESNSALTIERSETFILPHIIHLQIMDNIDNKGNTVF